MPLGREASRQNRGHFPEFLRTPLSGWAWEQYFQQGHSRLFLHPDPVLGPIWNVKERTRQGTLFLGGSLEIREIRPLINVGFCLVPSIKQGPFSRSEVHRRVSPGALEEGFPGTADSGWGPSSEQRRVQWESIFLTRS